MNERRGHVLLVDDDPFIHRLYAMVLQNAGYLVESVSDGPSALARLKAVPWDVVVSDIAMPGMDGLQLLDRMHAGGFQQPVILMTAGPQLETAVMAVERGAFRYLQKPISIEMLLSVVAEAMRAARTKKGPPASVLRTGPIMMSAEDRLIRFQQAMQELWIAYQPIVHWSERRIFAQEMFVRTRDRSIPNPQTFFSVAESLGQTLQLGRAIRQAAVREQVPEESLLCLKVTARDLDDIDLYQQDSPLSSIAQRVILELTERSSLAHIPDIAERVADLRSLGFRIALDEMGTGYGALSSLALFEPEMIKLDRELIRDIHLSTTRKHLVRTVINSCEGLNTTVVAEGVESGEELRELVDLGVQCFQGFLFGKPGPLVTNFQMPAL